MRELRPGLWHWEAPHPEWRPTEPWSENVSSYAIDDGEELHVGSRSIFDAAGFAEISHPTLRRVVMRTDF